MARSKNNLNAVLKDTADAIRAKTGGTDPIVPRDFADQIEGISTGGGEVEVIERTVSEFSSNEVTKIGQYAFAYCGNLTSVSFPNVTNIGQYAFYMCVNLEKIDFPNCSFIGSLAFSSTHNVSNISLPNLIKLGNYAIGFCNNVTNLFLPNLEIAKANFIDHFPLLKSANCPNLMFFSNGFGYCSELTEVSLPKLCITGFLANTFNNCSNLTSLYLPALTDIKSGAWFNQTPIENVDFPVCSNISSYFGLPMKSTLKYVNLPALQTFPTETTGAFYSCSSLERVNFFNLTGSIPTQTFFGCSKLSQACFIGKSLFGMANATAFSNTPMADSSYLGYFGSIYVHPDMVSAFQSATNWAVYSERITSATSEMMGDNIFMIEFQSQSSTLSEIPSDRLNAKAIYNQAFQNCYLIKSASFPECNYIGQSAFDHCSSLNYISFPNCIFVNRFAFKACSNLQEIDLPNCLVVGESAFHSCYSLTSVKLSNCFYLGSGAFSQCSNLQEIDLPNCYSIGGYVFYNLNLLSKINLPKLESIASWSAFYRCSALSEIYFPEIESIPDQGIFDGCINLRTVRLPKCSSIGSTAFAGCDKLETVDIPLCKNIGSSAFARCSSLVSISCPECTGIGSNAFASCFNLANISFPKCINIQSQAFSRGSSLSIVSFPKCNNIYSGAFSFCINLKEAHFDALTSIQSYVFYDCSKLESLYLGQMFCNLINSNAFSNTPMVNSTYLGHYGSIYVPSALLSRYQNNSIWSYFSERFVGV